MFRKNRKRGQHNLPKCNYIKKCTYLVFFLPYLRSFFQKPLLVQINHISYMLILFNLFGLKINVLVHNELNIYTYYVGICFFFSLRKFSWIQTTESQQARRYEWLSPIFQCTQIKIYYYLQHYNLWVRINNKSICLLLFYYRKDFY